MNREVKSKAIVFPRYDVWVRDFTLIMVFSALTALGAWIEIRLPFTPVPLTMQTYFVLLSGAILGWKRGAISQITYLLAGVAGLPVFSGGAAGWGWLLTATGGYLIAFPVAAMIAGMLAGRNYTFFRNSIVLLTAASIILLGGFFGIALFVPDSETALRLGVIPFMAGDFLKAIAVAGTVSAMQKYRRFK